MPLRRSLMLVNQQNGHTDNKILNGDFETDPTIQWIADSSSLSRVADGVVNNCLQIQITGGTLGGCSQSVATKIGHSYEFVCYTKKSTASGCKFSLYSEDSGEYLYQSELLIDADWTMHTVGFIANSEITTITLESSGVGVGATALFDQASLMDTTAQLKTLLNGIKFYIFSGDQAAFAHDAAVGDLLCVVSNVGAGVSFSTEDTGTLIKKYTETWTGSVLKTGVAAWFRMAHNNDDVAIENTAAIRIDGDIGQLPDFNMRVAGSTLIVGDPDLSIRNFTYTVNYNGD